VEGGCVTCRDPRLSRKLELARQFGHVGDDYYSVGINGKNSELHAAMGLAMLPLVDDLISERKILFGLYENGLCNLPVTILKPCLIEGLEWNYSYFPVLFESETSMLAVKKDLEENKIFPRRYFYPALNTLEFYGAKQDCPMAESIAPRILCIPFYNGLPHTIVDIICTLIKNKLQAA
jgi:dTDP-4-amino-4,6-dideoxygalactose transaminase